MADKAPQSGTRVRYLVPLGTLPHDGAGEEVGVVMPGDEGVVSYVLDGTPDPAFEGWLVTEPYGWRETPAADLETFGCPDRVVVCHPSHVEPVAPSG